MSERTDALIDDLWSECVSIGSEAAHFSDLGEAAVRKEATRDKDALRAEIAGIEAERDEARTEGWMLRELARMEREALIGASKEVERILRARITELEAAATNLCGDLRIWHDNGMYECYSLAHSTMELVLMRTPPAPEEEA